MTNKRRRNDKTQAVQCNCLVDPNNSKNLKKLITNVVEQKTRERLNVI